jgi:hypothetical protein
MNILTRMIQNGFRNIPVVFNEGSIRISYASAFMIEH